MGDKDRATVDMDMEGERTRLGEGRRWGWEGDLRIRIDLRLRGRLRISTTLEVSRLLEDTLLSVTITRIVSIGLPFLSDRTATRKQNERS